MVCGVNGILLVVLEVFSSLSLFNSKAVLVRFYISSTVQGGINLQHYFFAGSINLK